MMIRLRNRLILTKHAKFHQNDIVCISTSDILNIKVSTHSSQFSPGVWFVRVLLLISLFNVRRGRRYNTPTQPKVLGGKGPPLSHRRTVFDGTRLQGGPSSLFPMHITSPIFASTLWKGTLGVAFLSLFLLILFS